MTGGRVLVAGTIGLQSRIPGCRIAIPAGIINKRTQTDGRVLGARCEGIERIITLGGVAARIASVRWWTNGLHWLQKREADKRKRAEKATEPQRRAVN